MSLSIAGEALDYYLSKGYYRMQQDLFTCRFLPHDNQLHTVHWLRLNLTQLAYGGKQRQLLRQNGHFTVAVRPFYITAEYAALYARYHQAISFDAAPTLEALLLDSTGHNVFDTNIMEVRDGEQLIAAGVFDSGYRSLAGIVNFYLPEYRKYSLGKFLMLLKIEYARQQRMHYYYPGYLVHGYPKFDYKLFPDQSATEVFDCLSENWLPFSWAHVDQQAKALLADWLEQGNSGEVF